MGCPVILVGTSFGCQVIVDILTYHLASLPAGVEGAALLCGYPLYGEILS